VRLKKIKLAGFKSFVEPTSIPFPGEMTAVVGPNGCGKSNVIDAVRWVLGESSAKNLRGDAMTDVIFNGSSSRKPVGQCSVELIFDNSSGRISGEYANYNELSVKRLVTREAQSTYFLNGAKCRRRDVTDLFLGTGLGPRSYAIIEQGMISRLIESKPQELRVFIEEAAGISKYKERRRETENRIKHTQDNLERLTDVRDELGRQLEKLQRQAAAAMKYKALRAQARDLKGQLAAIRFLKNSEHIDKLEQNKSGLTAEMDALIARQQGDEAGAMAYKEQQAENESEQTPPHADIIYKFERHSSLPPPVVKTPIGYSVAEVSRLNNRHQQTIIADRFPALSFKFFSVLNYQLYQTTPSQTNGNGNFLTPVFFRSRRPVYRQDTPHQI